MFDMIKSLDDWFEEMPDAGASEEEIEAFMTRVMKEPGGLEMIQKIAGQLTAGLESEPVGVPGNLTLKSPARFVFRVELLGTKPRVWRRLSLPADCAFFHLHGAIQDAFGWEDCHLHRFEVWEEGRLEVKIGPGEEEEEYDEVETRIMDLFREDVGEFLYRYDFGDDWEHRVVVEDFVGAGIKETSTDLSPKLHAGEGQTPPEDCGGVPGFTQFLQGNHPFCDKCDEERMEEFRRGKSDLSKVVFRDVSELWRG